MKKRFTAICLAVMLVLGLSVPAMATGNELQLTGSYENKIVTVTSNSALTELAGKKAVVYVFDTENGAQLGRGGVTVASDGSLEVEVQIDTSLADTSFEEDAERYEIRLLPVGSNTYAATGWVEFDDEPGPGPGPEPGTDDDGKKPVAPVGPSGKPSDPGTTDPGTDPTQPGSVSSIFTDVDGHWAVNNGAIQYVYDNKLMTGATATSFAPNATTTRAQIFVILARRAGVDTEGGSIWYQKGLDWMVSNNYSDGTNPNSAITRQELAALLYRVIGAPEVTGDLAAYPDASAVSDWAVSGMLWATQNGIISGTETGALNPTGNATRAEVATILMRFCQQYPVQAPAAE